MGTGGEADKEEYPNLKSPPGQCVLCLEETSRLGTAKIQNLMPHAPCIIVARIAEK
jgi:hypothetical protein